MNHFFRNMLSWKPSNNLDTEFCLDALEMFASKRSSTPIRVASSPHLPLWRGCGQRRSRSVSLEESAVTTTSSLSDYGEPSSTRSSTDVSTRMAGLLRSALPVSCGVTDMYHPTPAWEAKLPMRSTLRFKPVLPVQGKRCQRPELSNKMHPPQFESITEHSVKSKLARLVEFLGRKDETCEQHSSSINYSKTYNLVLIHVPKTGGTSFGKLLGIPSQTHQTYSEYCQSVFHKTIKGVQTIAFARDPIERFVSLYNYARMPISHYHNNIEPSKSIYGKHLDYEVLTDSSLDEAVELLIAGKLNHDKSWLHWRPQVYWLLDRTGKRIGVNHIIKLEEANMALKELLGIDPETIPQLNPSKRVETDSLSSQAKEILVNYYADDYKHLGYDKSR